MTRASHSRGSARGIGRFAGKIWFAAATVLLAFAVTLPQGSTGFVESRWVTAVAWLLGVVGLLWKPADPSESDPATRWARMAVGVLIGICLWQLLPLPESAIGWAWRGNPELLGIVAADAPSFGIAVNRFVSLHMVCLWSGLGLLAWACSRHLRSHSAWKTVFFGAMALGIFQSVAGLIFLRSPGGRLVGTFGSPDAFGGLLAMTLPMTLSLIFRYSGRTTLRGRSGWQWWTHRLATTWSAWIIPMLWVGFAVQWMGLLFSGSIGATLAALAACILLLVWQGREHSSSRRFVLRAAAALVLLAVIFSIQGYRRNVLSRSFDDSGDVWRSQISRIEIWRAATQLCRQFPWGTGPGGTATVLSMYQTGVHGRYRLDYAHNEPLQVLGDLGPIGFTALVLLLVLTGWQGARGCRPSSSGSEGSVWLRRGAWVAFLSALLHAQGEFSLSARPGIQVFFVLVCGLLWAAGARSRAGREMGSTSARSRSKGVTLAWILACVGVVAFSLAAAQAWRLQEGVRQRLGLASDNPKWFSETRGAPEQALDTLRRANRLAPGSSVLLRGEAETRMALHQLQVEAAAREWLVSSGSDVDSQAKLDPLDPVVRQALDLCGLVLRTEEREMLKAAQPSAEAAVASAPWEAAARLVRARILVRRSIFPSTDSDVGVRGRQDLETVAKLYPEDAGVLAEACSILALAQRAEDRELLLDWGRRAIALNPSLAEVILHAWRMGGVSMEQVLQSVRLPIRVLWQLYSLLDREQRSGEARQCLAVLDRVLAENQPPPESSLWSSVAWNRWRGQQAKSRLRWSRESLKHALKVGDWNTVRSLGPLRDQAQDELLSAELETDVTDEGALAMKRLRLREEAIQGRLPPKWIVEWAVMELQAGQSAQPIQEPLLELFSMNAIDRNEFQRLFAFRGQLSDAPMLAAWMDAREAEEEGRPEEATSILANRLGGDTSLPPRFLHRLWLWQFQLWSQAGQPGSADEALARAVGICASDPDVIASLNATADSDASGLDIRFQGGRLRLNAVWMDASVKSSQEWKVVLDWRFLGLLPSDLTLKIHLRDAKGRVLHSHSIQVDDVLEARFNRGAPPVGSQWRTTVMLPPLASTAKHLQILLSSASGRLPTDEGLPLLELDVERLPSLPKETVEPKAGPV